MWFWFFVVIAVAALCWHALLLVSLAKKIKNIRRIAKPLTNQISELNSLLGTKPDLAATELAVQKGIDEVLVDRLVLIRRRRKAKAEQQRRLIENLKKIDPTERRFIRVRKRS